LRQQQKKTDYSIIVKKNTFRIQQREMVNKHKRELNGNSLFSGFCLNIFLNKAPGKQGENDNCHCNLEFTNALNPHLSGEINPHHQSYMSPSSSTPS
jgi:hypothetical protein